jgi:hypothetical protein
VDCDVVPIDQEVDEELAFHVEMRLTSPEDLPQLE